MASAITEEKIWHLQHCPLLSGLGPQEMEQLEHITVMVKLAERERIAAGIQASQTIWLVKEGLVSLTYGDTDGKSATVLLLGPGDLFGALADAEESVFTENAEALKPTVLCRMTRQQLESVLDRHPEMAYRVTKFTWCRIARLQQRLVEIMVKSVRQRLAGLLLQLASEYGADAAGARSIGLALTHDDLARLVGSSREMVSKVMGSFRQAGWVRTARKTTELVDVDALTEAADGQGGDNFTDGHRSPP